MPLSLLYEWLAFDRLEPFGYEVEHQRWRVSQYRSFLRNGMLIASLLNGRPGRRNRIFKAADFIPENIKIQPSPALKPTKSPTEIYQTLKTMFGLVGIKPTKRQPNADD